LEFEETDKDCTFLDKFDSTKLFVFVCRVQVAIRRKLMKRVLKRFFFRQTDKRVVVLSFIFLPFFSLLAYSQDNWASPPIVIGDSTLTLQSNRVILTGKIKDATGNSVQGATISVDVFKHFDYSDENGSYFLEMPPGTYKFIVRHVGKETIFQKITIYSNGLLDFNLAESAKTLEEIVVTSRALDSNVKNVLAGSSTLNIQEIKTLPALLGEVDVIKSLQFLPGVNSLGEGAAGFNVRGGRTDQNQILLNGTPIFNPNHALGFLSTFNPDVVQKFTLYKGNVPGEFGGRASSVLDVKARDADFDKWKFTVGLGVAASRLSAEGPLVGGKSSLLLGGRISNANWLLQRVKNPDVKQSRLQFYDLHLGWAHKFSSNSILRLTTFTSGDFFRFSRQFAYDYQSTIVNVNWIARADKKLSPSTLVSFGQYKNTLIEPEGIFASHLSNQINYFQLKEMLSLTLHENIQGVLGVESMLHLNSPERLQPSGVSTLAPKFADKSDGLEMAAFASAEWTLPQAISVSAGFRYSGFRHLGRDSVFIYNPELPQSVDAITDTVIYGNRKTIDSFSGLEPRISLRVNTTTNQSIKLSYNRMRQYIHQVSNTATPTPVDIWQISTRYQPPQLADNLSVGYFVNVKDNTYELSFEGFHKTMANLIEYKDFAQLFVNPHLETELVKARGKAYGFEVYARKLKGRWSGWLAYTYSRSLVQTLSNFPQEQVNNGEWYPANFDKPHAVNLVINKRLPGKSAFSVTAQYSTGRPVTALESSFILSNTVVPSFSARNRYRIPDYFRVDVSLTIGSIIKNIDDTFVFSIYNLLSRENAYSIFYQTPNSFLIPKSYRLAILGSALPSVTYSVTF